MEFTKMHGAGNDYLYIDARQQERDWPALAVAMSDRHKGVGSDGIILLHLSKKADLRMKMFNADGSEGEMCGNGIRCLVRYALDRAIIPGDTSPVTVETEAGVLEVTPYWDGREMVRARVNMGEPRLNPEDIPVEISGHDAVVNYPLEINDRQFAITCVSMGNPHAVAFVDEPVDEVPLHELGPLVEHHPIFPRRVNFEIANVLDPTHIKARVWERGSGLTMACGTGACAIAVAAHLQNYVEDEVTIHLPGGDLVVTWPGHGEALLDGPVAEVFTGNWPN